MPRRKTPPPLPDPAQFGPGTPIAVYARDSGGQAQEKSVPEQIDALEAYAKERGWQIVARYLDPRITGTDPGREGLNALLSALQARPVPFRAILVWSYSRLARETSIGYDILSIKGKAGIPIVSVSEVMDSRLAGVLEPLYFWQAEALSDEISHHTRRGMAAMVQAGFAPGGFPPKGYKAEYVTVGYKRDGKPRLWPRWIKDPEQEAAVARAWEMRLQGATSRAILQETRLFANASCLPTFWRNPAYCGFPAWYLRPLGLDVVDCVDRDPVIPPYVSPAQWLQSRARSADSAENARSAYAGWPLSGITRCGYCGGAVNVTTRNKSRRCDVCGTPWPAATPTCPGCGAEYEHRDGEHRYVCGIHKVRPDRCPEGRYVAGPTLERAVLDTITPHFTPEWAEEAVGQVNAVLASQAQAAQVERLRIGQELAKAQAALDSLLAAVEQWATSEAILRRLQERENEITRLKESLALLPDAGPVGYVSPEDALALVELLQHPALPLGRLPLRRLLQGLGAEVTMWQHTAEVKIDWPPLRLFVPDSCLLRLYPQGGLHPKKTLQYATM